MDEQVIYYSLGKNFKNHFRKKAIVIGDIGDIHLIFNSPKNNKK